jgi:Protein of unknown function (DUF3750)
MARRLLGPHPDAVKPTGVPRFTRYEVFGFGVANGAPAVLIDRIGPDNYWFGARPRMLLDRRGAGFDQMIAQVRAGVASYPYPNTYSPWPGPNSIPSCPHPRTGIHLPSNAVGEDFLPAAACSPRHASDLVSGVALWSRRHPARRPRGSRGEPAGSQFWSRPGQAGIEGASARQARDRGSMERHSPLFPVAEPGSSARSPSRWRTRRRHASRCIRARHRERRSDAAGR